MTVATSESLPLIDDYMRLDSERAFSMIDRLGVWVMISGEILKAIFRYPTEEQLLSRTGGAATGETLRALMREPELFVHRGSGIFASGSKTRILCRPDSPDFVLGEPFYTEGAMYRVSLNQEQPAPVDTEERGWR